MIVCIACNGAWREYHRRQSHDDRARFSAARMAFHRDHVSSLSLGNPGEAASTVRRIFQGSNFRDVTHWKDHFATVGASTDGFPR